MSEGAIVTLVVALIAAVGSVITARISVATHRQVTKNGGTNNPPTMPDRISEVRQDVGELRGLLEGHIQWSKDENHAIWRAIGRGVPD